MYPVVEATTALVFIMIWDAFFVARTVPALALYERHWPILIAYLFLFAALLASAGMDIESYTIHIQVLLSALVVGVLAVATAGFAPHPLGQDGPIPPSICLIAIVMGTVWTLGFSIGRIVRQRSEAAHEAVEPMAEEPGDAGNLRTEPGEVAPSLSDEPIARPFQPIPILLLTAIVVGLAIWQMLAPDAGLRLSLPPWGQRAMIASAVLMLVLVLASLETRAADQQIIVDLENERSQARGMILREFFTFIPALVAGLVVWLLLRRGDWVSMGWPEAVHRLKVIAPWPDHLAAGGLALACAILAASLGWAVRILGTLAFGKEAFGTGDIYILAAIGAVCGLWLVCISFLLAAMLALLGVLATSFRKTSRAIPFGPWLALGAFVGLWVERPLVQYFRPIGWLVWSLLGGQRG